MCGITGIVSKEKVSYDMFLNNRDKMLHRGPDDSGIWAVDNGNILLGHRRLSILDLSTSGHQPMESTNGRYVIVFNGEVYNYLELQKELEKQGRIIKGRSDTEVVLTSYIHWGDACLKRFNGMFSLAIFDRGTENTPATLFLARDRVGKKPFYYSHQNGMFAFASELKAIPSFMRGNLDLIALNYYLALGYIPGKHCIAEGVAKLPPGHAAHYSLATCELKTWCWWTLPTLDPDRINDVETLTDQVESLLHDAVRIRLRSDVPVGVLLSGGLDSSLIVASAAKASSQPINTFTIGLPGSKLDETPFANIVAKHFDTDHHVLEVPDPTLSILDEIAPLIDEPIADSSLIPAYMVSKMTADYVKVALGGDGGDELFGGYGDYTLAFADQKYLGRLPNFIFRLGAAVANRFPPGIRGRNRLSALQGGPLQSLVWGTPYFDAAARRRILSQEAVASLASEFLAPELFKLSLFQTGTDPLDCMTRTHFGSILPDDYLVKVDRASMAVGLEIRCPLLDVRLVEFAFGKISSEWKVLRNEGRRLQKRLGKRLLPRELNLNRKQGFSIPLNDWLRGSDKGRLIGLDNQMPEMICGQEVRNLIAGHMRGRANGSRLFALMMLGISSQNVLSS